VQFQESKNKDLGAAFVDFMLEPAAAEQVHVGDRLPARHDGGHQGSGYLDDPQRKPFAEQLLDHSAVYPPSPKWGGLEGANIFDGESRGT
jgi:N,N'-diacetylchitobiose transport system substrate-binding protein